MRKREQWGSHWGFILATIGSAMGLGNIWRFPTVVGESGGGAFLLIYLLIVFIIGIPLMIGELSIGRGAKRSVVGAFRRLSPSGRWGFIGFFGVTAGFVILSFYAVIAGWALAYIVKSFSGQLTGLDVIQTTALFQSLVEHPFYPLLWHGGFMLMTLLIVRMGINKGIELGSKVLMPLLFVLMLILAVRSVTLDGAGAGIRWYLWPDFRALSLNVILSALGQVFFSLSLGMGAIITYGSYLSDQENVPKSATIIAFGDVGIAFIAGLIIIPSVFAFGIEPDTGPSLIFITLPLVFQTMPWGSLMGGLFFLLLVIAALTSAISLLEVVVAYFMDELGWSRPFAATLTAVIIALLGVPSSLSQGVWKDFLVLGLPLLDLFDFIASSFILPLGGLLTAVFIGWVWTPKRCLKEINKAGVNFRLSSFWSIIVKFVLPVVLSYILVTGFFFS